MNRIPTLWPKSLCLLHQRLASRFRILNRVGLYRGADKSLARPGRKQATATEDFDVHISYL
jgi:hypothetical protein